MKKNLLSPLHHNGGVEWPNKKKTSLGRVSKSFKHIKDSFEQMKDSFGRISKSFEPIKDLYIRCRD